MKFDGKVKIKCLLWCDRHCCLCGKTCGVDIEVAHIDRKIKDPHAIDNAIPLCYECHANIGHYDREQPRGNKYSDHELKKRREQVYEEYTRCLVPPVRFEITQSTPSEEQRKLPDVGFIIQHFGDSLSVKALVGTEVFLDNNRLKEKTAGGGHYGMEEAWNLNPRQGYSGHFDVPVEAVNSDGRLKITAHVAIIDQYERRHDLLPMSWVYERRSNSWWAEP